ncbi:MAG TPA: ATP-dependent helicase HrpB, partial [Gemmatimonas sp.]|nr:ATP-dependent helicase HrpB [Gemmatimonas sp.]
GRIVMLEPRRLAARAAASYMARLLGESVGESIGYRIRGDTRVSARTRVEVVTEGVLARLLSADPALESYGMVIFDEFHERSTHADLGLALVLETQMQLRPELRVLVMSATLDGDAVAALLASGDAPAPVVRSAGRMFPITTHYRPPRSGDRLEASVARVIREAVETDIGDVLVFLPGAAEQRRVGERLAGDSVLRSAHAIVHVLHGSMPMAAQDAALAAAPSGTRKIVLATSVAETSLTIEGVRVVIDSGLSRLPRYEPRVGMTRLDTVRVSRASADQRRGRAGRTAPGVCYRIWDQHEEFGFQPATRPEILDTDLASLALELADAGIHDPTTLRWLDVPRAGPFAGARELLALLGAIDERGRVTAHGKQMAALPLSPRLAHLLLLARARGHGVLGAEIAALLEERDIVRRQFGSAGDPPSDLALRVEVVRQRGAADRTHAGSTDATGTDAVLGGASIDRDALQRVRAVAVELQRRFPSRPSATSNDLHDTGSLLALAFPDRVARRRPGDAPRFLMRNGAGATIGRHDALADSEWLAIAELDGAAPDYRVVRAASLTLDDVKEAFATQFVREETVAWHETSRAVRGTRRTMLGALVIEESVVTDLPAEKVRAELLAQVVREGVSLLPWSASAAAMRARLAFLHRHDGSWPDVSDDTLATSLDAWLGPHVDGKRKWSDLAQVDLGGALLSLVPWERRAAVDRLAPSHLEVPSGSRIALDYGDPESPVLPVKLQEVFGWTTTPTLMGDRVPVTLHLLSPAQRPVQVTRDLAGFWRGSYFEVRKELRGRYPRHPWPEDPLTAPATRRAKPRGT